ncbi:MAG: hypothetical protein M3Q55_00360 [Acidobacteriota bacterium]|nr:hypothetical protein [Acidobacteriota bacterium]
MLLTLVLGSVLAGAAMVAAVERQTAAAHEVSSVLRHVAQGGVVLAAQELQRRDWAPVLAGAGSDQWRGPLSTAVDVPSLAAALLRETMLAGAHGTDTPVWRLFTQAAWQDVAGHPARGDLIVWVADDWEERDGDPAHDSNGLVLVRAAAVDAAARSWVEALCRRESDGRVRTTQVRAW